MLGAAADGGLLAERERVRSTFALREAAIAALREARECVVGRALVEAGRESEWFDVLVSLIAASERLGDPFAIIPARDCTPEQCATALASAVVAFDRWLGASR